MDSAAHRPGGGLFESLYRVVMRRNSVYVTFVIDGAFLGERVVHEDGKKVRRQHPLLIVAENLPEDHCHQNLMKIFSVAGSVKTIRTCQPQTSNGNSSSASRSAKANGMHFSNKASPAGSP